MLKYQKNFLIVCNEGLYENLPFGRYGYPVKINNYTTKY